VSELAIT